MSDVKPALSPEEWAHPLSAIDFAGGAVDGFAVVELDYIDTRFERRDHNERHAIAALCLYGQPFGFTWEDVDLLRALASWMPSEWAHREDDFRGVADRYRRPASTERAMSDEPEGAERPMEFAPTRFVVATVGMRHEFGVFTAEALRESAARNPEHYTFDEAAQVLVWHPPDSPPPRYVLAEPPSDPIAWLNENVFGDEGLEATRGDDGKLHVREKPEPKP